jgi:hypothetical protein
MRYRDRPRDFAYLSWICSQQCVVCESQHVAQFNRSYAHHAGQRGLAQKANDRTAIPLCWRHHDRNSSQSIHTLGKEFWRRFGIDRVKVIEELNERYENERAWVREAA